MPVMSRLTPWKSSTVTFGAVFCFALIACGASAGTVIPQPPSGAPLAGLSAAERERFNLGKAAFEHTFTISEGLGPIFNKASCGNCHNTRVGGTGGEEVTRFGTTSKGVFDPMESMGGSLLQLNAIVTVPPECVEVVPKDATIEVKRVTNGALAFGLVEAISDADILANRDAQPSPVQGVAHMVYPFETPTTLRVGRFGWKAQVATVLTFSADAAQNELGLSNRFLPFDNAPNGNMDCLNSYDTVADPEDGPEGGVPGAPHFIDRVTDFQRFLSQPPQTPKSNMSGEAIFNALGCAACHTPSFTTADDPALEDAIRNKVIRPYSDWLLHYMGLNGDPIVQGAGGDGYVKTPPLWNLRTRVPLWHDGRFLAGSFAERVTNAILAHDDQPQNPGAGFSQGFAAAEAFDALPQGDKDKVIAFLDSLGRREFDMVASLSDVIIMDDFIAFADCYTGSGVPYEADKGDNPMDHPCAVSDVDQDNDVDLDDFDSFMLSYSGPRRDCNGNDIVDLRDVLSGVSVDVNSNGIPDSCEPTCDRDLDGNGTINVADLLGVIRQWGACPASPAPCGGDVIQNEVVNVQDLLAVIQSWGPCL